MKTTLLSSLIFLACGRPDVKVFCETPCGAFVSASNSIPQYKCSDYRKMETFLVLELSNKLPGACKEFAGVTAWELPGFSTKLGTHQSGKEIWAAGWTECENRRVSFHTGDGFVFKDDQTRLRNAWNTAYIHEFIHVAQKCFSPNPIDPGQDDSHSNWTRDGLENTVYNVIKRMENQ